MYIAFFDSDGNSINTIRDRLVKYTVVNNTELDVLWFEDISADKAVKYFSSIGIAFISLDCEELSQIGFEISKTNPDCYICYYKSDDCSLLPLLRSRPYDFFLSGLDEEGFVERLGFIINEYKKSKNVFCHETKRGLWCYPIRDILYLQSDMKYVNIVTSDGKTESVYAKLSEIEQELYEQGNRECFVRVHKSYIVNAVHVRETDKAKHIVRLYSGDELPISDACYKEAINKLKKFGAGRNSE